MSVVITGAAGFIGSCLISFLNKKGIKELILVDEFDQMRKVGNLKRKNFSLKIDRNQFFMEIKKHKIEAIFHIGARTDTTEMDVSIFDQLNLDYSKKIWQLCVSLQIPLIFASSAATYGGGEYGFSDQMDLIPNLKPLNPYGQSKHDFDCWVLEQTVFPPHWIGLKFFNVFGPNEYHKGRMASVIYHAFNQITQNGSLKLFQSHHPDYEHGGQIRDFIYVKDLLELIWFWYQKREINGIFNAGTGKARSFNDLGNAIFAALNKKPEIAYIPTPIDIRDKYQYFTEAKMQSAIEAGFCHEYYTLENAVKDYVQHYLIPSRYY
jgi:ADP-L-glycero-D-manno-heptose 6-epimerase